MATAMTSGNAAGGRPLAFYPDADAADVDEAVSVLETAGFRVVVERLGSSAELAARAAALRPDVLMVSYLPVTDAVFEAAPSVRLVSCAAVGVDNVDQAAAGRRGVVVCNIPDAATEEVATHALALALALVRHVAFLDRHVRGGGWDFAASGVPRRTSSLTFGVVGLGRIGSTVARLARPVFGRVVGHDPFPPPEWPEGVARVGFDECLRESDVLSLHLPLGPATEHLIDARAFGLMPPGSFLVNVSRGRVVDQAALFDALERGHLAGAALDVTDPEPPGPDDPVRSHPRLVVTPHSAFHSGEALRGYVVRQAENVIAWATTGRPNTPVVSA